MDYVAGVDVGGTHTKIALGERDGGILRQTRIQPNVRGTFTDLAEAVASVLREMQSAAGGTLAAIGIGNPGFTDRRTGVTVGGAPNVPCLHGNSLSRYLGTRWGVPAFADNDGTCAAAGELAWGAGRESSNFLIATLGTGIGGGLVLNGRIVRGARGFAGEVGHFCVQPEGFACVCGGRGCFEQYASATAILRLYQAKRDRRGLSVDRELGAEGVLAAAETGDILALQTVEEAARAIAQVFGTVTNLLNLDACIIGGGLSLAGDLLLRVVREKVADYTLPLFTDGVRVVRAELRNDAGVLGAAALAYTGVSEGKASPLTPTGS
jgi:glucokinase